jgi:ribose/xylose/arabinose/galactoside ABC-type transport system permease subunit
MTDTATLTAMDNEDQRTPADGFKGRFKAFLSRSGLLVALIILFIILSLIAPNFLTLRNQLNVLRQVSFVGIIACGMTLALIAAEVDLSVGSVVALASSLLGVLHAKLGLPLGVSIVLVIIEATVVGLLAGVVRVRWNIPALIVTLALMISLRGVAFVLTNAFPIPVSEPAFDFLGGGYVLGVPAPAIIFLITVLIFWFISERTVYGRSIYAVGGNAEAARLSGIPVSRIRVMILGTTAFLSAISGVLLTSRLTSGYAGVGVGWEFDVIAAVLIGGTSLFGGEGSIVGTVLGVLFVGLLGNGMVLLGVNPYLQDVARGAIILLAVWLSAIQRSPASS